MEGSPCLYCTRVADPEKCENKRCGPWRQWFLGRWELIHSYPRRMKEMTPASPVGVSVGGRHYAAPHETKKYLMEDPCGRCGCIRDTCLIPCRERRSWDSARKEAGL